MSWIQFKARKPEEKEFPIILKYPDHFDVHHAYMPKGSYCLAVLEYYWMSIPPIPETDSKGEF